MKVFVDSIGCRLNQSEIEQIAAEFRARGHVLIEQVESADVVVINTCAVTGKSLADSRRIVRQAALRSNARIIATGCWATLEPEQVGKLADRIEVVGNREKEQIVNQVLGGSGISSDVSARKPLPGGRFRTRAFIKVQEGCDQHCTFCITRVARGRSHSLSKEKVLTDIRWAAAGGAREAVLTGVNLGAWGKDLLPVSRLSDLIQAILEQTDIQRLRLSSLEPWDLDGSFFHLWQNQRMCRHLHLPLQSGSNTVLKLMGRKTNRNEFAALVARLRQVVPEMAISTDIIIGFPGEDDAQFEETLSFVRFIGFSSGHVFAYSPRPGTSAANLPDHIAHAVKKSRSHQLRSEFEELSRQYRQSFLGKELNVLWESAEHLSDGCWQLVGLSDNYLRVKARHPDNRWNEIDRVRLHKLSGSSISGEIIG